MISVVRLVTIHPVLTHFTIGGLPLIIIAYTVAVWLRSPLWTRQLIAENQKSS